MDKHARPRRQQTSRPKPLPPGEEDVSTDVILGEFQDVDTLTLSEASLVINALVAKRRNDRKGFQETEILAQTVDYLDAFARFKQKENVEAVERLLSSHKNLNKFERAQIGMEPRSGFPFELLVMRVEALARGYVCADAVLLSRFALLRQC